MAVLGTKSWAVGEVATASNLNTYVGPPPPQVDINVYMPGVQNTNWSSFNIVASTIGGGTKHSTGAQNDSIEWNVILAAGTWTLNLLHQKDTDCGIITVALSTDGAAYTNVGSSPYNASASTIDTYAGSSSTNQGSSITGITIANTGRYRLRFKMETKNASSSNYRGSIQGVQLIQTA